MEVLRKRYTLRRKVLGPSSGEFRETESLERRLTWTRSGITYEADPKRVRIMLEEWSVTSCNKVTYNARVKYERSEEAEVPLVDRLNFATKEVARTNERSLHKGRGQIDSEWVEGSNDIGAGRDDGLPAGFLFSTHRRSCSVEGTFLLQLRGATQAKAAFSPAPLQGAIRPSVRVVGVGAGGLRDRRGCRTAIGDDGNTAVFGLTESYTEHEATDRKLPMQPPRSVTFGGPVFENELGFGWQAW